MQLAFGYTAEEVKFIIRPMGAEGKDALFSMGDDTPLAILSRVPRLLLRFFKQRFAQVTNPPIDPLREELVMSLRTLVGPRREPAGRDGRSRRSRWSLTARCCSPSSLPRCDSVDHAPFDGADARRDVRRGGRRCWPAGAASMRSVLRLPRPSHTASQS